eukprot:scaffold237140_cov13-Tisochrysis_lutea.AAC.1
MGSAPWWPSFNASSAKRAVCDWDAARALTAACALCATRGGPVRQLLLHQLPDAEPDQCGEADAAARGVP